MLELVCLIFLCRRWWRELEESVCRSVSRIRSAGRGFNAQAELSEPRNHWGGTEEAEKLRNNCILSKNCDFLLCFYLFFEGFLCCNFIRKDKDSGLWVLLSSVLCLYICTSVNVNLFAFSYCFHWFFHVFCPLPGHQGGVEAAWLE